MTSSRMTASPSAWEERCEATPRDRGHIGPRIIVAVLHATVIESRLKGLSSDEPVVSPFPHLLAPSLLAAALTMPHTRVVLFRTLGFSTMATRRTRVNEVSAPPAPAGPLVDRPRLLVEQPCGSLPCIVWLPSPSALSARLARVLTPADTLAVLHATSLGPMSEKQSAPSLVTHPPRSMCLLTFVASLSTMLACRRTFPTRSTMLDGCGRWSRRMSEATVLAPPILASVPVLTTLTTTN